jgi:serine/threonine protein kinase
VRDAVARKDTFASDPQIKGRPVDADYEILKELGRGSFAIVYKGKSKESGEEVAYVKRRVIGAAFVTLYHVQHQEG